MIKSRKFKKLISIITLVIMILSYHYNIIAVTIDSVDNNNNNYNTFDTSNVSRHIQLTADQLVDENINLVGRAKEYLINDQDKVPETPNGTLTSSQINAFELLTWLPSWRGHSSGYIDLKTEYVITHFAYYDTYGVYDVQINSGEPFHWNEMAAIRTNTYKQWRVVPVDSVTTRYIQIDILDSADSGIAEFALYGYQVGENPSEVIPDTTKPNFNITADKAIGINAFIDDPMEVLEVAGFIREYHNFSWTLGQGETNKFNPSFGGKWNFDAYYRNLHERGIVTAPCIQKFNHEIYSTDGQFNNEYKAVVNGDDPLDPLSYRIHASTMFQYAARYGAEAVDTDKLVLATDQEALSGLGYLTYYENWNEPDKTWETLDGYYSPYELAAMTSADYDGHEGRLGDTYGVKNADPNSKLVLGGVASNSTYIQYLDLMKTWFEHNRTDKKLAFDVINYHIYCGTNMPEQSDFKERAEEITNWRNINAKDKEVWITEFGWDTMSGSGISAPSMEAQRDWLIRSYLIGLGAGIDRMSMYMVRDTGAATNTGKYATSGLTTRKGEWTKKPSWYGVYTLKEVLKGFEFDSIIQENDSMYAYKFVNASNNQECYALWSPTSDGSQIDNYQLNVGNAVGATSTKLEDGSMEGLKETLTILDGYITVDVNESPVFITLESAE